MLRAFSFFAFAFVASLFFLPACQAKCASADDCEASEVCLFTAGRCAQKCTPGKADACGASQTCNSCASGSCPTCEDCVAACVDPPGGGGQQGGW